MQTRAGAPPLTAVSFSCFGQEQHQQVCQFGTVSAPQYSESSTLAAAALVMQPQQNVCNISTISLQTHLKRRPPQGHTNNLNAIQHDNLVTNLHSEGFTMTARLHLFHKQRAVFATASKQFISATKLSCPNQEQSTQFKGGFCNYPRSSSFAWISSPR